MLLDEVKGVLGLSCYGPVGLVGKFTVDNGLLLVTDCLD